MEHFDVTVIGAGPGGYVAAIRCAQLGMNTACVDSWVNANGAQALGGTCLNVGCIPSKALLDSSYHYYSLTRSLSDHGVFISDARVDLSKMMARKNKIVSSLTGGIAGLLRKNKVRTFAGSGALAGDGKVEITAADGTAQWLSATQIIIATGSVPVQIPVATVDGQRIVDNVGALAFDSVPQRLAVIGAGVIGLELGSVWRRLGSEVTLIEALPDFLPTADKAIAAAALQVLQKQGLQIHLGSKVSATQLSDAGVQVNYEQEGKQHVLDVDRLIVAAGRRANTTGLQAQRAGVAVDERGRIEVDDACRTSVDNIWAVGDVVHGPMLAHKASEEGVSVAERIAGQQPQLNHHIIPWIIYTHPEIAWVGDTEQSAKDAGMAVRTGSFPYRAVGRALSAGEAEGLVKIVACAKTDRILGVHVFGHQASELIGEAVVAMSFHASSEDLARTIHGHPTLSEALHEAALAVDERAIHI